MKKPFFLCVEKKAPFFAHFFSSVLFIFGSQFLSLSLSLFCVVKVGRTQTREGNTRRRRPLRDGRFDERRFGAAAATRRRGKIVFQKYYHDIIIAGKKDDFADDEEGFV